MIKTNIKRVDIYKNLSKETGFSELLSKKLIDDLINIICHDIRNNDLNIKNLGSFKVLKKKQRVGRNPKTGQNYLIKERNTVSFYSSKSLLKQLN